MRTFPTSIPQGDSEIALIKNSEILTVNIKIAKIFN